jgi:hypothetical protein
MGQFNMVINRAKKRFDTNVGGFFNKEDAIKYIADYQRKVITFNPKEFEISLDCRELKVSAAEMIPLLQQCMIMYKESGFSKIIIVAGNSPILKMQIGRVAGLVGLDNMEII